MTQALNNWGPVVIIILGYIIGFYFQNKRLDDFKEGLYKYLDAKFESINIRLKAVEDRLDKVEKRIDRIEEVRLIK
jgi:hypothetical protein